MLVLALEFSRGSTARAHHTANYTVLGHARGERPAPYRQGAELDLRRARRDIAGDTAGGRSLKTEERGQVPSTGAGSVSGGLESPKGPEAARHLPAYDDTK